MSGLCARGYGHRPHTWIDDHDVDQHCPGRPTASSLPELVALNPKVAGIGLAARIELEVMSA